MINTYLYVQTRIYTFCFIIRNTVISDKLMIRKYRNKMRACYAFTGTNSFSFSTTVSISSLVLFLQNEKRTAALLLGEPIAVNTCEPTFEPEEQALPPEEEIPAMSKLNNIISPISDSGKDTFNTVYKLFSGLISPLKSTPGIAARTLS